MGDNKAPGPNGMTVEFFKSYWHLVGADISRLALSFLNGNNSLAEINNTFVVLIPKVVDPTCTKDFCLISLCNVFFKIISKAMTIRLQGVLPSLICDSQLSFVASKKIFDSAIVAYETFNVIKNKRSRKIGQMALKLDMSKSYNGLEWDYIEAILLAMSFGEL